MSDSDSSSVAGRFTPFEEIEAEGEDWFGTGYEVADRHVQAWMAGHIALGKPILEQPASAVANRLFRNGFNKRITEHMTSIIRMQGFAGAKEAERLRVGVDVALSGGKRLAS